MVVGEAKRTANIMDGIENTGDVRLHDHRLRLKQRFDIVRKLGQGTYGKVQLGINKKTGQEVAIKTIKKCKIESEADLIRIRREVQIMSSVRHPNIVHIYEVFENSEKMILVMEYCSGGELYDYLSQKKVLQEDEARRLFRQIATAVYYCHIHKICHRDLKLENVLLDQTGSAKIADFGLSNVFKETSLLSTFCGSPLYASPEIVKGTPYIGPEVDCWSLGVLLYTLVYGAMPFDGSNFKRLVRQISNGDYYEPKNPSTASPLIRDMLTVDPLKRADIAYICDHPWVNTGCETSCLEVAEVLAAETPVRLDLLLSLAPAAPSNSNSVVVPPETELGPEESCTDLTNSASMAVEPSNSAEKRILELVAEGGEDAIKPSPTRTIVSASDNKRKLELAMSSSGLQRKKERVASCASIAQQDPVPEEAPLDSPEDSMPETQTQPTLKSSATITIAPSPAPAPVELARDATKEIIKETLKEEDAKEKPKPRVTVKKKTAPTKVEEKASPENQEETKVEEPKQSSVAAAADKLTSLSLSTPTPAPGPAPAPAPAPPKPKKLSIPGGNVGNFKDQFERRASLTSPPETKRLGVKPETTLKTGRLASSTSKLSKPKAQSEDRELTGAVRLQQIGIQPSPTPTEEPTRGGVKKTESEPTHGASAVDPSVLLQDARRSLQSSMAKLVEEKAGEEHRRRAARDIISTAIRTGKPPVPYGRSSSAGVTSLVSPPGTPPAVPSTAPPTSVGPRVFRTEAQHRVEDHRNRGVSVERIIPIQVASEDSPTSPQAQPSPQVQSPLKQVPAPAPAPAPRAAHTPLRRLVSSESAASECSSPGDPIKKSAREFIIPIAVEGKGYVTPRQRSLEPEASAAARGPRAPKPRRISSLVSGGESEEEDDTHMHRLRSTRAARAESVSSGEEDEEDEGFHLLTAENLFSTLLHRVRALTNRLNGEEGPGFPQHSHSLFNNLQSPFFNRYPTLTQETSIPRGLGRARPARQLRLDVQQAAPTAASWVARYTACSDQIFTPQRHQRQPQPRHKRHAGIGSSKKAGKRRPAGDEPDAEDALDLSELDLRLSEREMRALSGLTPALSRRLQRQLLAHLPPAAARSLRRTLSLHDPPAPAPAAGNAPALATAARSHSARDASSAPATPADLAQDSSAAFAEDVQTPPADSAFRPERTETTPPRRSESVDPHRDESVEPHRAESAVPHRAESGEPRRSESTQPRVRSPPRLALDARSDSVTQFCTLPRLRRRSTLSREKTPPSLETDPAARPGSPTREPVRCRATPDRSLLSKYLTPERTVSLDDSSYSSDGGSILSEPSYVAAYGGLGLRRHSMRLAADQPRRKSRFLRSDFFDSPDESVYAKHKKEKELETQKILREIREKKSKALETGVKSPTSDYTDSLTKLDDASARKCLSPVSLLAAKERSRSTTPFFPILDNIKETALDTQAAAERKARAEMDDAKQKSRYEECAALRETRLTRPKSYPVKNIDSIEDSSSATLADNSNRDNEIKEKNLQRESKLIRPKSYPTSSPSPEKVYINRSISKKEETQSSPSKEIGDVKGDIEVSFSITLPKKKIEISSKTDTLENGEKQKNADTKLDSESVPADNLLLRKYHIINNDTSEKSERKLENGSVVSNGDTKQGHVKLSNSEDKYVKVSNSNSSDKKDEVKAKSSESDNPEKKGTIRKKIIKKVSSKSKTDLGSSQDTSETKSTTEKKKVTKKVKEKVSEDGTKSTSVTKKKSVLQSIGHKLEKLASTKSSSPEKGVENGAVVSDASNDASKLKRRQREKSVPVSAEPPTESNLIKRAVTLTDVAALDSSTTTSNAKTTVSKVLGLFKKFEPKDKSKPVEKSLSENLELETADKPEIITELVADGPDKDKPKRPTSLLLNGLGRKNKYGRTASDSVSAASINNDTVLKKETESKNLRNTLKLDFSRLPRVKKIVPTNPVIEPTLIKIPAVENETDKKDFLEKNGAIPQGITITDNIDSLSRSRSRSRSIISNSELKSDLSADGKSLDKHSLSPSDTTSHHPLRNHESTSPEKEDIGDRIRRKSFYTRFNEKKLRRKSSLVGPGAAEYDPLARIHSPPVEIKSRDFDVSPTSPGTYDLSPGYSVASDISPSTERYRSLLTDLPVNTRSNLRYDNYGLNDKIDTYRSLDRNDFRKYPSTRSYLDYDQPSSYGTNRYSRTKSLLDSSDGTEDTSLGHLRDPQKYNRTLSMYSPGNYATYRPKRTTRNSAIILKESEKEPSPENILEKIRQRKKISISVTRKPDSEKDPLARSTVSPKGESDRAECSEKTD